jgi:hypothetical protein
LQQRVAIVEPHFREHARELLDLDVRAFIDPDPRLIEPMPAQERCQRLLDGAPDQPTRLEDRDWVELGEPCHGVLRPLEVAAPRSALSDPRPARAGNR